MATQHQTIDIHLPSGLILRNAVGLLCAKFGQWPWSRFDGIPVADPFTITDADVDISFSGGRARTNIPRDVYKAQIRERSKEISEFLRAIPLDVGLEDEGFDLASLRQPIVGLYDCLAGLEGVKLANATKTTYRWRMQLLPVLDSALNNYYWYATSICDEERFLELRAIQRWGDYAFALLRVFQDDLRAVRREIDDVREAIREQPFAGASRVRILESLIWFYYLGR